MVILDSEDKVHNKVFLRELVGTRTSGTASREPFLKVSQLLMGWNTHPSMSTAGQVTCPHTREYRICRTYTACCEVKVRTSAAPRTPPKTSLLWPGMFAIISFWNRCLALHAKTSLPHLTVQRSRCGKRCGGGGGLLAHNSSGWLGSYCEAGGVKIWIYYSW